MNYNVVFQRCIICHRWSTDFPEEGHTWNFAMIAPSPTNTHRQRICTKKTSLLTVCQHRHTCLHLLPWSFPVQTDFIESILKWEGVGQYKNWIKTEKSASVENHELDTWIWSTDRWSADTFSRIPQKTCTLKTIILLNLLWICTHYTVVVQYSCLPLTENLVECFVLSQPQEISSLFVSDCGHVNWQTEQHVKRGEVREHVAVSSGHGSCPWAGAAVYLWDRRLRALPGPASAPDWLQGGVRQPQTSQLWPLAWGSSGTTHGMTSSQTVEFLLSFFLFFMMIVVAIDSWRFRAACCMVLNQFK